MITVPITYPAYCELSWSLITQRPPAVQHHGGACEAAVLIDGAELIKVQCTGSPFCVQSHANLIQLALAIHGGWLLWLHLVLALID